MKRTSWDGDAAIRQQPRENRRTPAPGGQTSKKPPLASLNSALFTGKSKRQKQASLTSLWATARTPSLTKQVDTPSSDSKEKQELAVWPSTAQRKLERFGIGDLNEQLRAEEDQVPDSAGLTKRSSSRASCSSVVDADDFQLFSQPEYSRQLSQDAPAVPSKEIWNSISQQDDAFGWLGASQHLGTQIEHQGQLKSAKSPGVNHLADYKLSASISSPQLKSDDVELPDLEPVQSLSFMLSASSSLTVLGSMGSANWGQGGSPYRRGSGTGKEAGPGKSKALSTCCLDSYGHEDFQLARAAGQMRGAIEEPRSSKPVQPELEPLNQYLPRVAAPQPFDFDDINGTSAATPELSQPDVLLELDPNGHAGSEGSGASGQLSQFGRRHMFPLMRQVSNRKVLCIIRHGESTFNAADATCKSFSDPMIFDPCLTELGHSQTRAIQSRLEGLVTTHGNPLWVVSPLTRTIQSFLNACPLPLPAASLPSPGGISSQSPASQPHPSTPIPASAIVEIQPLIAEYLVTAGDVGRPASQLANDFPQLSNQLSKIPEHWWFQDPQRPNCAMQRSLGSIEPKDKRKARLGEFQRWLGSRQERFLVLVGHCSFWSSFLPAGSSPMANGEVRLVGF